MAKKKQGKKSVSDASVKKKVGRPAGGRDRVPHTRTTLFGPRVHTVLRFIPKSVNELSRQLGISQPYVHNLLKGRFEPRLGTAITISEALNVPLELLITPQVGRLEAFLEDHRDEICVKSQTRKKDTA